MNGVSSGGQSNVKLYRTTQGAFVEEAGQFHELSPVASTQAWDELICDVDLLNRATAAVKKNSVARVDPATVLAPVGGQEVWASAGIEGRVESSIGVKPCDVIAGGALDVSEITTNEDLAVLLNGDSPHEIIRAGTRIECPVQCAMRIQPGQPLAMT